MPAMKTFAASALLLATVAACGAETVDDGRFRRPRTGESNQTADETPEDNGCATATAKAESLPLHMVVVLDKSGSMCEVGPNTAPRDCTDPMSKWQQVTRALNNFFASPQSKGITVSLIAFPSSSSSCDASSYETPIAADVTLPDTSGQLAAQIEALDVGGSTPTTPALDGAINYGEAVAQRLAGRGKVAVVMATDGLPENCLDNSIASASRIAEQARAAIPTYVIGVGRLLDQLETLAAAGGTKKAFIVSNETAGTVTTAFSAALGEIRGESLACEYAIPDAPTGQSFDLGKVNVRYAASGAEATTLEYAAGCTGGEGWRYDDVSAATKIQLCPGTCDRAKADQSAKLDVVLGCKTVVGRVR